MRANKHLEARIDFLSASEQRREALLIEAHIRQVSVSKLIAQTTAPRTEREENALRESLVRRRRGEPLAYILGNWQFYADVYKCSADALAPRNDSECLVEHILKDRRPNRRLLEIGTGSGILALSIARARRDWRITATDISPAALRLARQNACDLGENSIQFLGGDLFDPISASMKFDVILSNPPYVSAGEYINRPYLRHEPRQALFGGADGLAQIKRILRQARPHLARGGRLIVEHGMRQGVSVRRLARSFGYTRLRVIYDYAGRRRGIEARIG